MKPVENMWSEVKRTMQETLPCTFFKCVIGY